MDEETCLDCKKVTETILDHISGDTVCTECGLVVSNFLADPRGEWRTFTTDDGFGDRDPNRVGAPTNPLLKSGGLGTIIDNPKENTFLVFSMAHNLDKNSEDVFLKAFDIIKRISGDLDLVSNVNFRACEIISKLDRDNNNSKVLRREKNLMAYCAASVSMACRELNLSRTLKEISSVVNGVDMSDIRRASLALKPLLGLEQAKSCSSCSSSSVDAAAPCPGQVIINTGELVRRFCSKLNIEERETKAIREAIQEAQNFDIRRNPKSVLAAIIFMICQLSPNKKRPIREIGMVAEVIEVTLKNSVKDMYPNCALKIIPKWYASAEDITKRLDGVIRFWDCA
ncbi:unnamed protein product [Cochlearia groenlandica]